MRYEGEDLLVLVLASAKARRESQNVFREHFLQGWFAIRKLE